ncbi:MAG TPA: hypothetical protein VG537_11775 [Candidatus Kapabacteria bacterium]|jgi:hypothetical protein|nr:hypothetical protein [Candidatus Kapabacteria bacterium]
MKKLIASCILLLLPSAAWTQSWQAIAPMLTNRLEARSLQLKSGEILVAGGWNENGALTECELYDPILNQWQKTGSFHTPRYRFEMQPLPDGRVIAFGGLVDMGTGTTETCEIYDPSTGQWTYTAPMSDPREDESSILLPDGRIVVIGGLNANIPSFLAACEIFDPTTLSFLKISDMPIGCYAPTPYYDPFEKKLYVCSGVIGGFGGSYINNVQIYDFPTNSWTSSMPLTEGHVDCEMQSGVTENHSFILFGGRSQPNVTTSQIEYFDYPSKTWKSASNKLIVPHWHSYAFGIEADSFLVVGGVRDPSGHVEAMDTTSWFDFKTGLCTQGPTMIDARFHYTGVLTHSHDIENPCRDMRTIYVFGGGSLEGQILSRSEKLVLGPYIAPPFLQASDITFPTRQSCNAFDTSIAVMYVGCGSGAIDSIVSETSAAQVSIAGPVALGSGDTVRVPLHIALTDTARTAKLLVYGVSEAGYFTKEITVTLPALSLAEIAFATASLDLKNGGSVAPGDTITVPVQVQIPMPSASRGYTISLAFDSNALELVTPDYTGTLSSGTTTQTWTQYSTGATLTVPTPLTVSSGTLLNLRFRAYLTKNPCTTLRIFGSQFETSDSLLACTLPADSDSVQICVGAACVGPIRELLSGQSISIDAINVDHGQLNVSVGGMVSGARISDAGEFEFYNIMGRQIATPAIVSTSPSADAESAQIIFDIRSLPSGPYFVRMVQNGASSSKEFIVK